MTKHDSYEAAEEHEHERETQAGSLPWIETNMADRLRAAYAGDIEKPTFTIGEIPGGAAPLVYPSKVSGIAGDSGSGKSWIALAMALGEARTGGYTLWIDYEDTGDTLAIRMMELGWPIELGGYVVHFQAVGPSSAGLAGLKTAMVVHDVRLIVLDSTGESLASDGHNPNADEEVAAWFQELPRPLANAGPAVVLIDHLVKDKDTGGLWPSGSHRKRDAITGIQYIVRTDEAFDRDTPGKVTLICAKDRGGHHAQGKQVATVHFEPSGGVLGITATAAAGIVSGRTGQRKPTRPTTNMERVSIVLEDAAAPLSGRRIESAMREAGHRFTKGAPVVAAKVLVAEGYAEQVPGSRGPEFHGVRAYRIAHDRRDEFGEEVGDE